MEKPESSNTIQLMGGDIFQEVEVLGGRLGLPEGFFSHLLGEDDWSFVIKLNALVEATCTDALIARLHNPELASALSTLELGDAKHGKLALLKKLNALTSSQAKVLNLLLELRNKLAHNISHTNFSFDKYVAELDRNQRLSFAKTAGHGLKPEVGGLPKEKVVLANPKIALWMTVAEVLACLHLEHRVAEYKLAKIALESLGVRLEDQASN